jgi:hypothetical protein
VVLQCADVGAAPLPEEGDGNSYPRRQQATDRKVTDELASNTACRVISIGLEGGVVAEPLRPLVGLRQATEAGEQSGVIEDLMFRHIEIEALAGLPTCAAIAGILAQ